MNTITTKSIEIMKTYTAGTSPRVGRARRIASRERQRAIEMAVMHLEFDIMNYDTVAVAELCGATVASSLKSDVSEGFEARSYSDFESNHHFDDIHAGLRWAMMRYREDLKKKLLQTT